MNCNSFFTSVYCAAAFNILWMLLSAYCPPLASSNNHSFGLYSLKYWRKINKFFFTKQRIAIFFPHSLYRKNGVWSLPYNFSLRQVEIVSLLLNKPIEKTIRPATTNYFSTLRPVSSLLKNLKTPFIHFSVMCW